MKKYTVMTIIVALVLCFSVAPSATAASDEEEVMQVMETWFKAFNTNNYELMVSLHWNSPETSYFGPDNNNAFLFKGWDTIAEGFKSAFSQPVGSYAFSPHNMEVLILGGNTAIVTEYAIDTVNPLQLFLSRE